MSAEITREDRFRLADILGERLIAVLAPDGQGVNQRDACELRGVAINHALGMSGADVAEALETERQWAQIEARRKADLEAMNLHAEGDTAEATVRAPDVVRALVAAFQEVFDANPEAENYLEMRAGDAREQYVITVQRASSKTPHQLREKAEKELKACRAALIYANRRRRQAVSR